MQVICGLFVGKFGLRGDSTSYGRYLLEAT